MTFRMSPRDREAIDRLVEGGHFQNRSDFLRHAIRLALADRVADLPGPPLEIEGIDLPAATGAPARRPGLRRGRRGLNL